MRLTTAMFLGLGIIGMSGGGCKVRDQLTGGGASNSSDDSGGNSATKSASTPSQMQSSTPVPSASSEPAPASSPAPSPSPTPDSSASTDPAPAPAPATPQTTSTDPNQIPTVPGGPIAGIEVVQDNVVVTTITIGKHVTIRPTSWTKSTASKSSCPNPGIIDAVWTIGSRSPMEVKRTGTADCAALSIGGTFTSAGSVKIQLDVLTDEGSGTNATATYTVGGG